MPSAARPLALLLAAFGLAAQTLAAAPRPAGPERWAPQIAQFEKADRLSPPPKHGVLFVGSSSIRLWDLNTSFPNLPVINRGFGGSEIADTIHYAEQLVLKHEPRVVVLYAGDNDIARGKTPEQVAADYAALTRKILARLPETRIVFIVIKPSLARWELIGQMRRANRLIAQIAAKDDRLVFVDVEPAMIGEDGKPRKELFREDGLHLNAAGYRLWTSLVAPWLR